MGFTDLVTRLLRPQDTKAAAQTKTSRAGPMISMHSIGQPQWTPRRTAALAEEGFRKNTVAYRCVMQIATACAAVPWLAYDEQGNELDRHPLLDLLAHPNPLQDGVSFLENIYAHLQISGNAYIEAIRSDDDQAPVELYVLRPDRMKVVPGPTGLPQAYQYTVNGQVTTWPADPITGASNILQLKTFHPLDDWYGMAPMEAALLSIDQHNAAGAWNQALLNQGARPSGALVYAPKDGGPSTLSDDQIQRLREEMAQLYQGSRNAGRPLILEGGLDWREMSLSPKDMDWLAGRSAAARDIALAFGVPAQLIGIPDAQTYANVEQARLAFYEETAIPLITRVIAGVDHWLCPMYEAKDGTCPELDFDIDSIGALSDKRQAQWAKIGEAPFLTLNEKRAAAGYGPVMGGDKAAKEFKPLKTRKKGEDDFDGIDDDLMGDMDEDVPDPPSTNTAPPSWGNPNTLDGHFDKHGDDFGATSPEHYADLANDFYHRYIDEDLPALAYPNDGKYAVYDPETNTFGSYNPDGMTASFFKPDEKVNYYSNLVDTQLGRGGRVINPLPDIDTGDVSSGSNREFIDNDGGGGYGHGKLPGGKPWLDDDEILE